MSRRTFAAAILLALPSVVSADPPNALMIYERFKALEGSWDATSTKGWRAEVTFQTIAAGSAVIETSLGAHPGETMLTAYTMDGNRLLLTHYCVARNQPRLVAAEIAEDGRAVTFTFLDATNLPSRDKGHMDRASYRFVDDDHVTTRWTWYQDGRQSWMEEIHLTRRHGYR